MTRAALASKRLSVLVIEDNPADADLVRALLREAGPAAADALTPEIHHVGTLREALALVEQPFDVALLDLGLPDASGLEGLGALHAAAPDLPAVVLTGARDPALATRALAAGAEDFLVKDEVQGHVLLRALRFAVARRRAAREREVGGGGAEPPPGAPVHGASVRRVLLVEDNAADADLVRDALAEGSSGFAVHGVESLRDAFAYLASREADVVLLDLGLPDAAGMEGVDRLRAELPELPIVVLTGHSGAAFEAVRSGAQDYVIKDDLEPRGLQRAIDYAIERNAHARRARELAAERAAHAATQAAARVLEETNRRLALATREGQEALEREARARAEAEHRREEFEGLFASMIDPVLVYGEDGNIRSINRAAREFFGVDVSGSTPAAFVEAADVRSSGGARIAWRSLPGLRALGGAIVPGEKLRVRAAGGERVVVVSASPLRAGDAPRGSVCVYRDVTERDRAEQVLRENDERKTQFLAMLSHELRNPLAPIRNSVYLLERAAPGGEQARRACTVIDRQVAHLTRLTDDLLDVTRISHGKIRLQRERFDVSAVARQVAEDHRSLFAQNGVELQLGGVSPLHVRGDPTRVAQVIGNLLHNAAKFTPPGGHAALSVERAGDALAAIRVRDTGGGIAPTALGRIFEPFVQEDGTLERTHGGLGLGLALVKGIAELHGGSAAAHSDGLGKGAEFVVTLPLDASGQLPLPRDGGAVAIAPARRVLIIEDNADAAESLKEVLELGQHVVEIAGSGLAGLEKARALRPDVVLCDIGLPGMDGFEVAKRMRADPALRSTPLLALSGYAAAADLERAAEAGFDRHLAKPVDLDELEQILHEVTAGLPQRDRSG